MNEKEFKKLIIEVVRNDDVLDKEEILSLLEITTVRFEKTNEYTRHLWNHYQEYIYLCILPDKLISLTRYKDYLYKICDSIYPPNDEYEFWGLEIRPGVIPNDEEVSQEILFENIAYWVCGSGFCD